MIEVTEQKVGGGGGRRRKIIIRKRFPELKNVLNV